MSNPDVILDNDLAPIAPPRIPNRGPDEIVAMVIRTDKCHVPGNKNLVANFYVTLKHAMWTDAHVIPEYNVSMWRPHGRTPLHMNIYPMPHPRVSHTKIKRIAKPIQRVIFGHVSSARL